MTLTIRQLWLDVQRQHYRREAYPDNARADECAYCRDDNGTPCYWPCPDYSRSVAALKALDEAEVYATFGASVTRSRLVPDPAPPTENT